MTNKELVKAFEMRINGSTYKEIGEVFGCSKQHIEQELKKRLKKEIRITGVYPNLVEIIRTEYGSILKFSQAVDIADATARNLLKGKDVSLSTMLKISKHTGRSVDYLLATK